jgi:hydroxymethylbilane synthase
VAVHSAKDLPAASAPGLALAAVPERADARDAVICTGVATTLGDLRRGARVGTGSARRSAQLRALRPDLEVVPLRGNVGTRLRKLDTENLDAVILACAGLDRLGLADRITARLEPELLLPAPAQGALVVQTRSQDSLCGEIKRLEDPAAAAAVAAERAFLIHLGGDCNIPLAALAEPYAEGKLRLRGLVATPDGRRVERAEAQGTSSDAAAAGLEAAECILRGAGREILAALRPQAQP